MLVPGLAVLTAVAGAALLASGLGFATLQSSTTNPYAALLTAARSESTQAGSLLPGGPSAPAPALPSTSRAPTQPISAAGQQHPELLYNITQSGALSLADAPSIMPVLAPAPLPQEAAGAPSSLPQSIARIEQAGLAELVPEAGAPAATLLAPDASGLAPSASALARNASAQACDAVAQAPSIIAQAPSASALAFNLSVQARNTSAQAPNSNAQAPSASIQAPNAHAVASTATAASTPAPTPSQTDTTPSLLSLAANGSTSAPQPPQTGRAGTTPAPQSPAPSSQAALPPGTGRPPSVQSTTPVPSSTLATPSQAQMSSFMAAPLSANNTNGSTNLQQALAAQRAAALARAVQTSAQSPTAAVQPGFTIPTAAAGPALAAGSFADRPGTGAAAAAAVPITAPTSARAAAQAQAQGGLHGIMPSAAALPQLGPSLQRAGAAPAATFSIQGPTAAAAVSPAASRTSTPAAAAAHAAGSAPAPAPAVLPAQVPQPEPSEERGSARIEQYEPEQAALAGAPEALGPGQPSASTSSLPGTAMAPAAGPASQPALTTGRAPASNASLGFSPSHAPALQPAAGASTGTGSTFLGSNLARASAPQPANRASGPTGSTLLGLSLAHASAPQPATRARLPEAAGSSESRAGIESFGGPEAMAEGPAATPATAPGPQPAMGARLPEAAGGSGSRAGIESFGGPEAVAEGPAASAATAPGPATAQGMSGRAAAAAGVAGKWWLWLIVGLAAAALLGALAMAAVVVARGRHRRRIWDASPFLVQGSKSALPALAPRPQVQPPAHSSASLSSTASDMQATAAPGARLLALLMLVLPSRWHRLQSRPGGRAQGALDTPHAAAEVAVRPTKNDDSLGRSVSAPRLATPGGRHQMPTQKVEWEGAAESPEERKQQLEDSPQGVVSAVLRHSTSGSPERQHPDLLLWSSNPLGAQTRPESAAPAQCSAADSSKDLMAPSSSPQETPAVAALQLRAQTGASSNGSADQQLGGQSPQAEPSVTALVQDATTVPGGPSQSPRAVELPGTVADTIQNSEEPDAVYDAGEEPHSGQNLS